MTRLRAVSMHSCKGGVGKSTLSVLAALYLSRRANRVYLIDADLLGTSLADVLKLCAPRWPGKGSEDVLDLREPPTDFHDISMTRSLIDGARHEFMEHPRRPVGVPFLNDYLLYATPEWDGVRDVDPTALLWHLGGGPDNLYVIPSSALPRDIEQVLPPLFDEPKIAFLEGRLERLLGELLIEEAGDVAVVFDTPPSIPGLSRSVLDLGLRLTDKPDKTPLSKERQISEPLRSVEVLWQAFLVSTLDQQDMRAVGRWLALRETEDKARVLRPLLNRVLRSEEMQLEARIDEISMGKDPMARALGIAPTAPLGTSRTSAFADLAGRVLEEDLLRLFRTPASSWGDESFWQVLEQAMGFLDARRGG